MSFLKHMSNNCSFIKMTQVYKFHVFLSELECSVMLSRYMQFLVSYVPLSGHTYSFFMKAVENMGEVVSTARVTRYVNLAVKWSFV